MLSRIGIRQWRRIGLHADRRQVLDALARHDDPKPIPGAAVSVEELMALSDGSLPTARRSEVLAHLAGDSELLRYWTATQQNDLPNPAPASAGPPARRRFWYPFSALASVLGILIAVQLLPLSGGPDAEPDTLVWPTDVRPLHWSLGRKGLMTEVTDQDRAAFAGGVAETLTAGGQAWEPVRAYYQQQAGEVSCPAACSDDQHRVWQLGQWAAQVRLRCLGEQSLDPAELRTLRRTRPAGLPTFSTDGAPDQELFCRKVEELFQQYL